MSAIGHTSDPEGARLAVEAMLAVPDLDCPMCRPDLHVECLTPGHRLCQPHLNTERGRARAPLDGQTFHLRQMSVADAKHELAERATPEPSLTERRAFSEHIDPPASSGSHYVDPSGIERDSRGKAVSHSPLWDGQNEPWQDTADLADAPEPIDPDGMYLVTWPHIMVNVGGRRQPSKRLLFGHRLLVNPVGGGARIERLVTAADAEPESFPDPGAISRALGRP